MLSKQCKGLTTPRNFGTTGRRPQRAVTALQALCRATAEAYNHMKLQPCAAPDVGWLYPFIGVILSYQHGSSCLVMEVLFHLLDLLAIIDGRVGFSKILLSTATVSLS